jgi:hypothetical protein
MNTDIPTMTELNIEQRQDLYDRLAKKMVKIFESKGKTSLSPREYHLLYTGKDAVLNNFVLDVARMPLAKYPEDRSNIDFVRSLLQDLRIFPDKIYYYPENESYEIFSMDGYIYYIPTFVVTSDSSVEIVRKKNDKVSGFLKNIYANLIKLALLNDEDAFNINWENSNEGMIPKQAILTNQIYYHFIAPVGSLSVEEG